MLHLLSGIDYVSVWWSKRGFPFILLTNFSLHFWLDNCVAALFGNRTRQNLNVRNSRIILSCFQWGTFGMLIALLWSGYSCINTKMCKPVWNHCQTKPNPNPSCDVHALFSLALKILKTGLICLYDITHLSRMISLQTLWFAKMVHMNMGLVATKPVFGV